MTPLRYRLLPRGLLARASLLLLIPFMGLQLALILAFWFGHWQPLTDRLSRAVVNELALLIDGHETQTLQNETRNTEERTELFVNLNALSDLGIRAASIPGEVDSALNQQRTISTLDRQLRPPLARSVPRARLHGGQPIPRSERSDHHIAKHRQPFAAPLPVFD